MDSIEPIYDKKKLSKTNVTQSNQLVRSLKEPMTILESRLTRFIIAQVMRGDEELRTYTVNAGKLAEVIGIEKNNVYSEFKDISKSLMYRVIRIDKGNGSYRLCHWYESIEYDNGKGNITLQLSKDLKEYLLQLEAFTSYPVLEVMQLPTDNAIRLYELLWQWGRKVSLDKEYTFHGKKLKKNQCIYEIAFLRQYFNCEKKYKSTGDFIRRIIDPSVEAIHKNIVGVKYEYIKSGKEIVALLFTLGY